MGMAQEVFQTFHPTNVPNRRSIMEVIRDEMKVKICVVRVCYDNKITTHCEFVYYYFVNIILLL